MHTPGRLLGQKEGHQSQGRPLEEGRSPRVILWVLQSLLTLGYPNRFRLLVQQAKEEWQPTGGSKSSLQEHRQRKPVVLPHSRTTGSVTPLLWVFQIVSCDGWTWTGHPGEGFEGGAFLPITTLPCSAERWFPHRRGRD